MIAFIENAGALGAGAGLGVGGSDTKGARVFAQLALPAELSALLRVPSDRHSSKGAFLSSTNTHDGTSAAVVERRACASFAAMDSSTCEMRRAPSAIRALTGSTKAS